MHLNCFHNLLFSTNIFNVNQESHRFTMYIYPIRERMVFRIYHMNMIYFHRMELRLLCKYMMIKYNELHNTIYYTHITHFTASNFHFYRMYISIYHEMDHDGYFSWFFNFINANNINNKSLFIIIVSSNLKQVV